MTVELRITSEGTCECGIPHQLGYEPGCRHDIECDWGTFDDPPLIVHDYLAETTTVENAEPLILVSKAWIDRGCTLPDGCSPDMSVATTYTKNGHRFLRQEADNGSWTWELFDAHWADGYEPNVYVGRWPD